MLKTGNPAYSVLQMRLDENNTLMGRVGSITKICIQERQSTRNM